MLRPSNPIPELLFNFRITPLTRFKLALNALIDRHFNPIGLGLIEVKEDGVDFTAQNVDTKATGILRLKSTALKDFHFNGGSQERLMRINFRQILFNISDKDESITLFHFAGSYNIVMHIGDNPVKEFSLRFYSMVPEFERFHDTSFGAAKLPSNMLREIIDRLKSQLSLGINELVSASLSQLLFSVYIGDLSILPWEHRFNDGVTRTMGLVPDQVHHAWFIWPHLEALRKASLIEPYFVLSFLIQPKEMIMTLHNLEDLGYLMMFSRAIKIVPNIHRISPKAANAAATAAAAEVPML